MKSTISTARRKSSHPHKLQQITSINHQYSGLLNTLSSAILNHSAPNEIVEYLKQLSRTILKQNAIYSQFKCPLLAELLIRSGAQNVQCLISMAEQKKLENMALKKEYEEQKLLAKMESANFTLQETLQSRKEELKRIEMEKQGLESRVTQMKYQYGETKKELKKTQEENIRYEIALRKVEQN